MAKQIVPNDAYPHSTNLGMQAQQALENGDRERARELSAESHVALGEEGSARERRRRALFAKIADEKQRRARKLKPMREHVNTQDYEHER